MEPIPRAKFFVCVLALFIHSLPRGTISGTTLPDTIRRANPTTTGTTFPDTIRRATTGTTLPDTIRRATTGTTLPDISRSIHPIWEFHPITQATYKETTVGILSEAVIHTTRPATKPNQVSTFAPQPDEIAVSTTPPTTTTSAEDRTNSETSSPILINIPTSAIPSINDSSNTTPSIFNTTTPPTSPVETATTTTPLVDTLNNVIARQFTLCGLSSTCTIRESVPPFRHLACCGQCSCHPECLTNRTCCVDYVLGMVFGIDAFASFAELQVAMSDHEIRMEIEMNIMAVYMDTTNASSSATNDYPDADNDTLQENSTDEPGAIDNNIECLPRHMVLRQGYSSPGRYYKIITGCRRRMSNSTDNCLSRTNTKPAGFMDNFPVTSFTTGITYRNKTVLECCEDANEQFEYWDMFVECRIKMDFLPNYVIHPLALLESKNLPNGCDIVFEPNDKIQKLGLVPIECTHVDINTCEKELDGIQGLFLKRFCEREKQYVRLVDDVDSTLYNNVACVFCQSQQYRAYRVCIDGYPSSNVMRMTVNLDDLARNQTAIQDLSDGGLLNVRDLPRLAPYVDGCAFGYIYVQKLGECRRVYCPRSMYIVNGSCVPLYDHVTGASYSIIFNMTIISPVTKRFDNTTFGREFVRFLKKDHFRNVSLAVGRIRMRTLGHTHMVEMILTPINETSVILRGVVGAVTSLYYTTVDIRVSRTDIVEVGISPGMSTYFKNNVYFKSKNVDVPNIRNITLSRGSNHVSNYKIEIAESYICYRIGLDPASAMMTRTFELQVPVLNITIPRENIDFRPSSEEVLTCVDAFFNGSRHFQINLRSRVNGDIITRFDENAIPDVDNQKMKYSTLIVIIGVAGVVFCVVARLSAKRIWDFVRRTRNGNEGN